MTTPLSSSGRSSYGSRLLRWNWRDRHGFDINVAIFTGILAVLLSSSKWVAGPLGALLLVNLAVVPTFLDVSETNKQQVWGSFVAAFISAACLFSVWHWTTWWAGFVALDALVATELRPREG